MTAHTLLTYRGTVYPWHCDQVGHMNVMWYVGKFDEATWHLFHAIGLTPTRDFRQDVLFSFQPTPGTVVLLGYGATLTEPDAFHFHDLQREEDGLIVKVSYLFRL